MTTEENTYLDTPLIEKGDILYTEKHYIVIKRVRKYGITCKAFDKFSGEYIHKFEMLWEHFVRNYEKGKIQLKEKTDYFNSDLFEI